LASSFSQATTKTLAQQQEQLKRMESISALQETNRMLKINRDKLEQELQQTQAKVRAKHWFILRPPFFVVAHLFTFTTMIG